MNSKDRVKWADGISFHLARQCMLIAVGIGLALSLFQIFLDREKEQHAFVQVVDQFIQTNYDSGVNAVYNFDLEGTKAVAEGLMHYNPIFSIEIINTEAPELSYSTSIQIQERTWLESLLIAEPVILKKTLYYQQPNYDEHHGDDDTDHGRDLELSHKGEVIGEMIIKADPVVSSGNFITRAFVIIVSGVVRNLIMAIIFMIIFQLYVARPMYDIVDGLSDYDPDDENGRAVRLPITEKHKRDELGVVSSSVNSLFQLVHDYLNNLLSAKKEIEEMNETLEEKVKLRTQELQQTNNDLRATLDKLEKTQAQLVASEKLSALGEVVAGLAHEIQNPLNFINNFSEISIEMLQEAVDSLNPPDNKLIVPEGEEVVVHEVRDLIQQVTGNAEKVHLYGQRVAKIVSCMLMHTTSDDLIKEPLDLNVLVKKYVGDSIRKTQKKHSGFTCEVVDQLDIGLEKCEVNDWAIGRVLVNIIDNAMYSMSSSAKMDDPDYQPTLEVETYSDGAQATIRIRDNGDGIPEGLYDKIFQPFFTTTPTGVGVGLGLSVAHDFVTQHNGILKVNGSVEGEYAEFVCVLPLKAED